ncbi:TPA: hypothetical protein MYV51_003149 [Citrobacter amalonaticus]|uniref:hypothetical protein n=1 Tax=Citrobacter amalonaticus TaxID=35703 RepID=UPI00388DE113|nr:hypothetical protein [Citrobacter amalonaticus]
MKYLIYLVTLITFSSQAAVMNEQKAAQDLCDMEWNITDRASGTDESATGIVNNEVKSFKDKGYSFSDFSIDETDFIKVSMEGAEGSRKMIKQMDTPYSEARDFLKGRMMSVCVKNVLDILNKEK